MSVDITTALGEAAVVEISEKKGEPEWLRDRRIAAFQTFLSVPNPGWDRTNIDRVDFSGILPYKGTNLATDVKDLPPRVQQMIEGADPNGALLVQVDSTVAYRRVSQELESQGVIFTSFDEAVQQHPELVKEHFMTLIAPDADKLIALHAALHSGGAFVYVPKDVKIEIPLEFATWSETDGLGLFPHVLVIAEDGAEVTLVERYSSGDEGHVVSQLVEVVAKANAKVTLGSVQSWGGKTDSFHTRRAHLERDSVVNWVLGELGSRLGRAATHSSLVGDGSESTASMVFFGDQEQHLDTGIIMNHIGSYTNSDMLTKGVLKDKARCIYRACTDIEDGARNTTGFQIENTLMLSKDARIDAIPELEIEETEVQAGHAATVAQVDETQLFYMMSRGVPRSEAVKMVVQGFVDPLLSRIPLDDVRQELQELIDRKMAR